MRTVPGKMPSENIDTGTAGKSAHLPDRKTIIIILNSNHFSKFDVVSLCTANARTLNNEVISSLLNSTQG
jgi:hypothetical protein